MSRARAHVVVSGKVQGVYFRSETRDQALALGVTGWIRNRTDGTVEGVFEGDREMVEKLVRWCWQGPPAAEVSNVQVEWQDYTGECSGFKIAF